MAIPEFNLADIQMAMEMFDASPDGAAERERVQALIDSLPDVSGTFSGHWCGPDCQHCD
jgi:hypothetical protein